MQASSEIIVSAAELQLRSFEMGRNLSTRIEVAADAIVAESADPKARRNALLWKISAIPLVQEAAVRIDPQVAAADLLAVHDAAVGLFHDWFGAQLLRASTGDRRRRCARGAARNHDFASGAFRNGKLPASAEAHLREWVAAHPMSGPSIRRASVLASDWKALGMTDTSRAATLGNVIGQS